MNFPIIAEMIVIIAAFGEATNQSGATDSVKKKYLNVPITDIIWAFVPLCFKAEKTHFLLMKDFAE